LRGGNNRFFTHAGMDRIRDQDRNPRPAIVS
jgi:hypothetical protein